MDLQARMARARAAYIRKVREEIDQGYVLFSIIIFEKFHGRTWHDGIKHSTSILSRFNVTREKVRKLF